MAKYRKRPLEVEVTGQFFCAKMRWPKGVIKRQTSKFRCNFFVVTIHGQETRVVDGDWIIEEPDGKHHYPCKPDIFDTIYEKVEE